MAGLESKVLDTNVDIKKLLHACHISVKNSVDYFDVLFCKINELREDQLYFFELMEKEHMAKGKGKKDVKDDGKGHVARGLAKWKKPFEVEKKELLDMIGLHRS